MIAHAPPMAGRLDHLGVVRRWGLLAVMGVAAMVPWYTLRLFPLITVGTAKVNLLDALVGLTVLAALPCIVPLIRSRSGPALWVLAFVLYMLVPLVIGLGQPDSAPKAIRDFRALTFYALALAFGAEAASGQDFQAFARVFVAGACVAIAAVFVHLRWLVQLPGYTPDSELAPGGFVVQSFSWNEHLSLSPTVPVATAVGYRTGYLEWTVALVAFTLALGGMLSAPSRWERALWGMSVAATTWYLLASGSRSPQVAALCAAIVLGGIHWGGNRHIRRTLMAGAAMAIIFAVAIALGVRSPIGGRAVSGPVHTTLLRWSQVFADASLRIRAKEIVVSLPQFARHPFFGGGLGVVTPIPELMTNGKFSREMASGFGFLLIRTGLLGFLLYVGMVGSVLRLGWRHLRNGGKGGAWPAALIGEVGIAVLLVLNLVHNVVDIPEGVIAFSLFFGMIVASESSSPGIHRGRSGPYLPPPLAAG